MPTTGLTTATAPAWVYQYVRASKSTEKFEDPKGNTTLNGVGGTTQYNVTVDGTAVVAAPTYNDTNNSMSVRFGQVCDNSGGANATTATGAGSRNFAVVITLESGDAYCQQQ